MRVHVCVNVYGEREIEREREREREGEREKERERERSVSQYTSMDITRNIGR